MFLKETDGQIVTDAKRVVNTLMRCQVCHTKREANFCRPWPSQGSCQTIHGYGLR
jgi:hypothetical protein